MPFGEKESINVIDCFWSGLAFLVKRKKIEKKAPSEEKNPKSEVWSDFGKVAE